MEAMRRVDEISHLRDALPTSARVTRLMGDAHDAIETTVLGYLQPEQRAVGDIVATALGEGLADEYDVLRALSRLRERGVVQLVT
jgi:hypothetical protein